MASLTFKANPEANEERITIICGLLSDAESKVNNLYSIRMSSLGVSLAFSAALWTYGTSTKTLWFTGIVTSAIAIAFYIRDRTLQKYSHGW